MEQKQVAVFQVDQILGFAMIVGVTAVAVAYLLQVQGDVKADMPADSAEYNATAAGITAVAKIPTKLSTIVTVGMAAVIIGLLIFYFARRFMR